MSEYATLQKRLRLAIVAGLPTHRIEAEINAIERADLLAQAKGMTGDSGAQGWPGPQGEAGPEGPQGEIGPVGPQGEAGRQGIPGRDGVNGKDGKDGRDGKTAAAGRDGRDGADGRPGIPGDTGPAGPAGPRGASGRDGVDLRDNIVVRSVLLYENEDSINGRMMGTIDTMADGSERRRTVVRDANGRPSTVEIS